MDARGAEEGEEDAQHWRPQGALLDKFLQYCTERVTYNERGTPDRAMTFASMCQFLENSRVLAPLPPDAAQQFIEGVRPPDGRFVTWTDFRIIIELAAEQRYPHLPIHAAIAATVSDILMRYEEFETDVRVRALSEERRAEPATGAAPSASARSASSPAERRDGGAGAASAPSSTHASAARSRKTKYEYIPRHMDHVADAVMPALAALGADEFCRRLGFPLACADILKRTVCIPDATTLEGAAPSPGTRLWRCISQFSGIVFPTSPPAAAEELTFQIILNGLDLLRY